MAAWPTDEQIRTLAAEILERDEYAHWHDVNWLAWLDSLRAWSSSLSQTQPVLYWTLLGAMLAILILLLAHITWSLRAALAVSAPRTPERPGRVETGFLEEAEALARGGHFLEAARRLQLAAIDLLLRSRTLELYRSDPNRTLRLRLRDAPLPEAERGELLVLIDRFERCWFRDRREDRDLYESWHDLYARLGAVLEAVLETS